jgi:lipoate-protein ligase A
MLRYIQRTETDPYYNLAAEEYLLKSATVDTFMTWRNEPSVIVGKHQNTLKEINPSFIETNKLPVIRRITGGGAVYHDPGNINFSFIYTGRKENLVDFIEFTQPVILFLQNLGLNATFQGKNNIFVDGFKVSGNSAHIFKNKVLHHGTLLFNTDLNRLEQAIAGREDLFQDKAVKSVRANVANISALLAEKISVDNFIVLFRDFILKNNKGAYNDYLDFKEKEAIRVLAEEKYMTYQWNFGYSPEYNYHTEWEMQDRKWMISLVVKEGIIVKAEFDCPTEYLSFLKNITNNITGAFHEKKSLSERLKKLTFADEIKKEILNQIMDHLF